MTMKRFLAFVVAFAMVMSIMPAIGSFAAANEAVALFDGVEYNSLSEAVAAASDAFVGEKTEIELLCDTDEDFTLEGGIVYLVTGEHKYTGTATVEDGLLITDCALYDVVCESKATDEEGARFGYASIDMGVDVAEGAQVRIGAGATDEGKVDGEDSGLRFIATVDQNDTLASYAYGYYNEETGEYTEGFEIGMAIKAEESAFTADVPATLWQEAGSVFTAALTNLAESNYNRRYTAKAYVEFDSLRFESESSSTRSIYQVASGLLSRGEGASEMSKALVNVLNAYVNQTGVRLTLTDSSDKAALQARMDDKKGGYTGDAFFTVGDTVYRNGMYEVELTAVGKSVINTKLFNEYVRINNNNSQVSNVTGIVDNGNGKYTITFDYADLSGGTRVINEAVTLNNGDVTAYIPEGVQFTGSAKKLELVLTAIDDEKSEVEAGEGEDLDSFDIHVNGVSEDNITPIIITLSEMAQKGLNRGNLALYHVEDGVQVKMEQVDSVEDLTKHNQFTYNPLDGTVTIALASFSEVALVSTDAVWQGTIATDFAGGKGTETDPYLIANADQLAYFGQVVGGMISAEAERKDFEGEFVKLVNDIDLGDAKESNTNNIFYPIGYYNNLKSYEKKADVSVTSNVSSFSGTFDGNGHTIKNFYQNTWEMFGDYNSGYSGTPNHYKDAMGLFGYVVNGTVKNLTVENFSSDGEFTPTGVIAAYAVNSTFENIAITNCNPGVYNTGNGGIVGIGGNSDDPDTYKLTFTNITIDNTNKITALWGSWDVACGGLVGMFRGAGHAYMTNCHVAAQIDVYNDVCGNYQYYWYRYAGMMIGTNKNMITDENGYTVPETSKYHTEGCTVHFGDWNNYWYCELVANSIASYTHDHQFSRLTRVDSIDVENMTITVDGKTTTIPTSGRVNYVVVTTPYSSENATCYHFVNGEVWNHEDAGYETVDVDGDGVVDSDLLKEDRQHYYLPFNQLFTGYGWGVKHIPVYNGEDYAFEGITILDRVEANSEVKFAKADTAKDSYTTGTTVTIGELFKAATDFDTENNAINGENVFVTVAKANDESTVSATYAPNTTDWTQGTLTFSGTGAATITITDYYFCTPTTITVNVTERQPEEKFDLVFKNTDKYLYRVGSSGIIVNNATITDYDITLGNLFKAKDGATIGTVSVTVEAVDGTGASGTYTSNATWTNGKIDFNGTGVVKVTIKDGDKYCAPTELYLEVVDAVNATGATNATSNNVVLLNDIGSGFTVSGRYTVYGNGFTLNYAGNGQYLNNGLKQGIVTVSENGTLDNLRIKASVYPSAFLYYGSTLLGDYVQMNSNPREVDGDKTRYYYQLSAVAAKGNATISNCYIYGARTNVFVDTGDVTIKDSVLECGTVANVQIQSNASHTVTFEDVTTIQYQVNPTIGDTTKVMLGAGVLVGPETTENPKIVLKGDFKQYNWVTSEDANAVSDTKITKAIIQGAVDATAYNHTVNGKTASNLGIIYMNEESATVENETGLPYVLGDVAMKMSGNTVNGKVYSLQNATADQIYSDYKNADKTTVNGLYEPQFKYSADLGGQHIAEGGDEHCYREGDVIHVMFPSGDTKELNLAALVDIAKYTGQDLSLEITCKDGSGNTVTVTDGKISLSAADTYTVTYTVTDTLFFDKDGNTVAGEETYSWDVTVSVSLKDTAVKDAYYEFDASKQKMGYYVKSSILSTSVYQYLPFLAGLKIYDYNGQTAYTRFNGDTDFDKVAKIEVTNKYSGNDALVKVTLTDGGVITAQFLARADSSGGSTYTGSIKTSNNTIYFVNDGTTSESDKTTTAAYWYVDYYKFTGNNGVEITSSQQTFNSTGSSASTPSGSFSTTIKYTVTYDANDGNCGQTTGYATSASTAVTLPTPTKSGNLFAGWYTAASGGTRVGGAGESYTPSANITLYAQWGKPCTVTYDANGGSCGTASEKYTGTALTLPEATRDGYWFVGWYDAAEGGKKIGDADASYNPANEITLYAHWQEKVEYTVTYNANGGSCTTASATYQGTALELPTPSRTGYTFNGWYTAASGGTKIGDAGATYTPSANITLYAQWTETYTVTYNANSGSVSPSSATVNAGESVTLPTPTRSNYTFNGWYTAASGGTKIGGAGASYTPSANITLYAQWTKNSSGCFAEGTLITLADGTQKPIEEITFEDELLAWDFNTGSYAVTTPSLIDSYEECESRVINLKFDDGTTVRMVVDHGFFDKEANNFVFLDETNVDSYVGHEFVKVDGNGGYTTVKLTGYDVTVENVSYYAIQTAIYNNCIAENMFTLTSPPDMLEDDRWFDYFEIGDNMKYDEAKMQADIEKYGLYDYADFAEYVTYEQFIAFNGPYLKVLVGKGIVTYEQILELIETYVNPNN